MNDPVNAATEIAKTANTGLELAGKTGSFIANIFRDTFAQIGGMASDQIRLLRYQHLLSIQDRVDEIHRRRGIEGKTISVPLKIGIPLIEAASFEDDLMLQSLWALLIANATDPQYSEDIHPAYIEIVKQLCPDEALVLSAFASNKDYPCVLSAQRSSNNAGSHYENIRVTYNNFCNSIPLKRPEKRQEYLDNLLRLELVSITTDESPGGITLNPILRDPVVYQDRRVRELMNVTAFGTSFIRAAINQP